MERGKRPTSHLRFLSTENDSKTTISIAGKLEEKSLVELDALCAGARKALVLDLSELQSKDDASIR